MISKATVSVAVAALKKRRSILGRLLPFVASLRLHLALLAAPSSEQW